MIKFAGWIGFKGAAEVFTGAEARLKRWLRGQGNQMVPLPTAWLRKRPGRPDEIGDAVFVTAADRAAARPVILFEIARRLRWARRAHWCLRLPGVRAFGRIRYWILERRRHRISSEKATPRRRIRRTTAFFELP